LGTLNIEHRTLNVEGVAAVVARFSPVEMRKPFVFEY
jgi:hypothetical protein